MQRKGCSGTKLNILNAVANLSLREIFPVARLEKYFISHLCYCMKKLVAQVKI
jgi:hypothetical protein